MAGLPDAVSGKRRKRQTGKAASRPAASKVKATVHLSVEADQRLNIHGAMMAMSRPALVERMQGVQRHL